MSTVIVFGGTGLLGASLVPALRTAGYCVLTQGRGTGVDIRLDPTDREAVETAVMTYRPTAIVNLVAATNVDQCESDPEYAWSVNSHAAGLIADAILKCNAEYKSKIHLVHVSTDQVYDGLGPHTEETVRPINVYGLSKYTGELLVESIGATVLRSNFYGRSRCSGRQSFSDWIVNSLNKNSAITVFDDVRFNAMHIDTLCSIIIRCIDIRPLGVLNAGCCDWISKAGFAFELANELGLPTNNLKMGKLKDMALKARRPHDMTMSVKRIQEALGIQCPSILEEIKHTAMEYLSD